MTRLQVVRLASIVSLYIRREFLINISLAPQCQILALHCTQVNCVNSVVLRPFATYPDHTVMSLNHCAIRSPLCPHTYLLVSALHPSLAVSAVSITESFHPLRPNDPMTSFNRGIIQFRMLPLPRVPASIRSVSLSVACHLLDLHPSAGTDGMLIHSLPSSPRSFFLVDISIAFSFGLL